MIPAPHTRSSASATPLQLILAILLCEAVGFIGAIFSGPGPWYQSLQKPSFTPPAWIFGPVWITLYALMGVALALVWNRRHFGPTPRIALGLFAAQLLLNGLWSPVFFGLHALTASVIIIFLLLLTLLPTTLAFWRVSRPAGLLLLPYLAWTAFAALLNFSIWNLNR